MNLQRDSESHLSYGKIPPQNRPVEELVLGILMSDREAMIKVSTILKAQTFYLDAHQRIWNVIQELYKESLDIEPQNVVARLMKKGDLDMCGGPFYITQLVGKCYQLVYIESYALMLKELQFKRDLIVAHTKSVQMLYEDNTDVFDCLIEVKNATEEVIGEIQSIQTKDFGTEVIATIKGLKESATHGYKTGVPFYQNNLDHQTGGAQKGDLIILAARPSMGKSALMIDCARKQAENGIPVGIISIEMNIRSVIVRMISQQTSIDMEAVGKGGLRKQQWEDVDTYTYRLLELPFYVEDQGGIGISVLVAKAKSWAVKHGIKVLWVDYLQLAEDDTGGSKNREQEVSTISRALKKLAKELKIPVIALAQLSRSCELRSDKRPLLSDLRESGGIEQDADVVIFLYREGYYQKNDDPLTEAIIAKYRNGKTGRTFLNFNMAIQTFTDYSDTF